MENLNSENLSGSRPEISYPVHPTVNVPPPSGLNERISHHSASPRRFQRRIVWIVLAVFILAILGVGGWWYYAQGQVLLLMKQAKWSWGLEDLQNYQQDTNVSLEIKNRSQGEQDIYAMFFGGEKFNLDVVGHNKNIGANTESDVDIKAKTEGFNLDLGLQAKKIEDKLYFTFNLEGIEDLLTNIFGAVDQGGGSSFKDAFQNIWFEMDINDSYNISIDKDKLAQLNNKFNDYLQQLKKDKIFDFTDLKEDSKGFRKIKLTIKEDKIEQFIITSLNYQLEASQIFSGPESSDVYKQTNEQWVKDFEKMKVEKPADWEKMKQMFKAVELVILINPDTKNIHGLEIALNNFVLEADGYATIFNGSVKYFIDKIDSYEIVKPANTKQIGAFGDLLMGAQVFAAPSNNDFEELKNNSLNQDLDSYFTDTDGDDLYDYLESFFSTDINNSDTDGDGYLDGQEISNGYNPTGDGLMDPEMVSYLKEERLRAKKEYVQSDLKKLIIEAILCEDIPENLQYVAGNNCDGSVAPTAGNLICPSSYFRWPDITVNNSGFTYLPCNSDTDNNIWEYGATNGDVTIICSSSEMKCLET